MSKLSAFFAQNVESTITEEFVVSNRIKGEGGNPIPWQLRAISEDENEAIRKSCTRQTRVKGQMVQETNGQAYMAKLVAACVVFPDLKDVELQNSYGVRGEEDLLRRMLLAGEYATLAEKVQELNGYDRDINDLKDEVKN